MKVEKAKIADASQIHKLINHFASKSVMLPRSLAEIYENIRDYFVVKENDRLVACAALHINWADLAEIKGLAVLEDKQNEDLGSALVEACLEEGQDLGIHTIFCPHDSIGRSRVTDPRVIVGGEAAVPHVVGPVDDHH